ncbi:MAG: hypothetical protein AB198_02575, partial [Parcubacteria bacterium C7867-003]
MKIDNSTITLYLIIIVCVTLIGYMHFRFPNKSDFYTYIAIIFVFLSFITGAFSNYFNIQDSRAKDLKIAEIEDDSRAKDLKIAEVEKSRVELENALAPRIIGNQDKFAMALKNLGIIKVEISTVSDFEAYRTAGQLRFVL